MTMNDATIILGSEEWQVKFVRRGNPNVPRKKWGICDWDNRIIYIRKDLSTRNVLDTLLHEMRHAQHPVMFEAEHFINWTSTELADGLIASGMFNP
jgi:hypothetical protein